MSGYLLRTRFCSAEPPFRGRLSLGHQHPFHDQIVQIGTKKHIERVSRYKQRLSRAAQTGVKKQAMTGKTLERTEQLVKIRFDCSTI